MVEEGMAEGANDTLLPSTEEEMDRFSMTFKSYIYQRLKIYQKYNRCVKV